MKTAPVVTMSNDKQNPVTRDGLAEFLHERFALDHEDHWSELDEQEQADSEYADMADALLAEFTLTRKDGPP